MATKAMILSCTHTKDSFNQPSIYRRSKHYRAKTYICAIKLEYVQQKDQN
jgi:hypothetical protein